MNYSVIIRAHQVNSLLVRAIQCLNAQSLPPCEIILVDSSRDEDTGARMKDMADIHIPYGNVDFNYSRAIRLGVAAARSEHVLIHSTHVALTDARLVEDAFRMAVNAECDVFYCRKGKAFSLDRIDMEAFDGRNGLANSCAMIPRQLLLKRSFREEVFSAEDQEWAAWFIREMKGQVLRITTPSCCYENPHLTIQKKINEDLAIALYVNRGERALHRILARFSRAAIALVRNRPERARLHWSVAFGLLSSYFKPLQQKSRYF